MREFVFGRSNSFSAINKLKINLRVVVSLLISSHCFDVKLSSCQLASAYEQEASWAEHILLSSSAFINSTRKELSFGPVKPKQ